MNTQLIWNLSIEGMMGAQSRSYPHGVPKVSIFTHLNKCGGSLWATCIIVCASSSPSISISISISISFIGFLIHLISISILLDNYVIINSKSDTTQK